MIIITSKIFKNIDDNNYIKKIFKNIDDNNYIKKYSEASMIIIDDNNYIENIQKDWWEYLDQKNTTKLSSLNV